MRVKNSLCFGFVFLGGSLISVNNVFKHLFPFLQALFSFNPLCTSPLELLDSACPENTLANVMICQVIFLLEQLVCNLFLYAFVSNLHP